MKLFQTVLFVLVASAPMLYANAQEAPTGLTLADGSLSVEKLVGGFALPTAMSFVDNETMLVLEKDNGTVRVVQNGVLLPDPALDIAVANDANRGLLGIDTAQVNGTTYVFLYYTESGGGVDGDDLNGVDPAGNRLYRYELSGSKLVNPKLLLDLPALPGPRYDGGTVQVGPDGFVYVVIGDVEGHATQAQNFVDGPAADGTSGILRIGMNGEVPPSVIGTGVFGKYYYAYGIRNSFGMDFDPVTGNLWDTENGPASGDEINLVDPGFNSGWRDVFGMSGNQSLHSLVTFNAMSHYSEPKLAWVDPIGPTALAFLDSNALGSEFQNDIFVGDILNGAIYRFDLTDNRTALALTGALADRVSDDQAENRGMLFGTGFGGITDIKTGPDGALYVLSFADGAIYRVSKASVPAPESKSPSPPVNSTPTEEPNAESVIARLATALVGDDSCISNGDRHKSANAVAKVIKDIYGDNEVRTSKLLKALEKIVNDCQPGQGHGRGHN